MTHRVHPHQTDAPTTRSSTSDDPGASRPPRHAPTPAIPHIHPERDQLIDLPPRLTPIFGRDADLARVADLLSANRFITLTGPGGVGKTRLAIECAYREAGRGVWRRIHVVPLATVRDSLQVLATIALRLEIPHDTHDHQTRLHIATALADIPTLLVLDGLDQGLTAVDDLEQILALTPSLTVIATCRQAIGLPQEIVHDVPCLPISDDPTLSPATMLFIDRVHRADPAFEIDGQTIPQITAICDKLDGLPLAIELAAARIKLLSLEALLERLAEQIDVLSGGPRDQPLHQRTMRATIAWSYDTLQADEQALFRALSWFDMSFSRESAQAMHSALTNGMNTNEETDRLIGILAERHLLRRMPPDADGTPTFQMLTTIRTFGRDCSRQLDDERRIRQAHAEGIAAQAMRRLTLRPDGTIDPAVLPAMASVYPDIERTLIWFESHGDGEAMVRLVIALAPYWTHRFARADGCRWFERALARVSPTISEALLAQAELEFAALLRTSRTGDLERAQNVVTRALDRFRRLDDLPGKVATQNMLGVLQRAQGDLAHAEGSFDEALTLAETWGHPWWNALILCNLGATMLWLGETREARHRVEEAIRQFQDLDDHRGVAFSTHILALIRCIQGDARTAAMLAATGLDHATLAEARETTIDLIAATGFIAAAGGVFAHAISLLEVADHLANQAAYRMERPERETYEDARRIARRALGNDQAEHLIQEATHYPLDAAVELARAVLAQSITETTPPSYVRTESGPEHDQLVQTLTIREHQVLALLAQRYTDKEIAETLEISVRTVSRHVSNVFGKLGLHSRRDVTVGTLDSATSSES